MKLRLETVSITNVKGIEHLEFPVASLTLFTGGNAEGKSSALDACRSVIDGKFSHDPGLIRHGADKAEVIFTLSNGTAIRRLITQKNSMLTIRTKNGAKVKREAEYVAQLASGFAFDPLKFLAMKPKEQAAELMKVMPIVFQPEELIGITNQIQPISLEALNGIREGMYEDRTKYNVLARELDGSVADLQRSIPPDSGVDWAGTRDNLGGQLRQKRSELEQAESGAKKSLEAATKELERVANDKIRDIREKLANDIQDATAESNKFLRQQTATLQAELEHLTDEHATARQNAEAATMALALRAQLKKAIDKRGDAVQMADDLTARMKRLDAAKLKKLKELPIPGADFKDGELYIDGGPLRHLNDSDRMLVAIQIGKQAVGELGFMVSDYFTEVDEDRIGELAALLPAAGLQLAAAFRIRGEDLKVRPIRTPEDIAELKAAIRESVSE